MCIIAGGVDTGWTFYTPLSTLYLQRQRDRRRRRCLHRRLFVDRHRHQFHRHDPHAAGAGHDLAPAAAVRLGDLRHQPGHGAGDAGAGHVAAAGDGGATARHADLQPRQRRRPAAVPAPVLVLQPPGGLHHDLAGDGRRLGGLRLLRAPAHLRLHRDGLRDAGHRGDRLHGLGPPHVRVRPVAVRQSGVLVPVLRRGGAVGDQGVQLDGDALSRPDHRSRRRCSTRWASSACSPSAA